MKSHGGGGIPDGIYLPQDVEIHLLPEPNYPKIFLNEIQSLDEKFWKLENGI